MPRIAVFGGTGYLASLIKNQNNIKKNQYIFFSRKKNSKNYINYSTLNKNLDIFKNFDFVYSEILVPFYLLMYPYKTKNLYV